MTTLDNIIKIVSKHIIGDMQEFCFENGIEDQKEYFKSIGKGSCWKGYLKSFGYDNESIKEELLYFLEESYPGNTFITDELDFIPDSGNAISYKNWINLVKRGL